MGIKFSLTPLGTTSEVIDGQRVVTTKEQYGKGTKIQKSIFEIDYVTGKDVYISTEISYDIDGDGTVDSTVTILHNKGGRGGMIIEDKNADGTADYYEEVTVTDKDGIHTEMFKKDTNGDGKVDRIQVLTKKDNGESTIKNYTPEEYEKETGKSAQFSKQFGL